MKKIDSVKRRFLEEGLETASEKQKAERSQTQKADGDFEASRRYVTLLHRYTLSRQADRNPRYSGSIAKTETSLTAS